MKATVKQISIKQRLDQWSMIRFQILIWCSLRNIRLTDSMLDMLALLSLMGKVDQTKFCEIVSSTKLSTGVRIKKIRGIEKEYVNIFNSSQSARNSIVKAIELGLIKKEHKKHDIEISDNIEILNDTNLLINYQFLCIEAN